MTDTAYVKVTNARKRRLELQKMIDTAKEAIRDFLDLPARDALAELGRPYGDRLTADDKEALSMHVGKLREALALAQTALADHDAQSVAGVLSVGTGSPPQSWYPPED